MAKLKIAIVLILIFFGVTLFLLDATGTFNKTEYWPTDSPAHLIYVTQIARLATQQANATPWPRSGGSGTTQYQQTDEDYYREFGDALLDNNELLDDSLDTLLEIFEVFGS